MHSHAYSDLSKVNAANSILLASSDCIGAGLPLPLYVTTPSFNQDLSVVWLCYCIDHLWYQLIKIRIHKLRVQRDIYIYNINFFCNLTSYTNSDFAAN